MFKYVRCAQHLTRSFLPTTGEDLMKHFGSQVLRVSTMNVTPKYGLVDSDLTIQVEGLLKEKPYTLLLYLMESGLKFVSCGHYVSSQSGTIDCVRDRSLGGTFDGVERHGLIWSMVQAPGQREGLRLIKRDVTKAFDVELTLHEGHKDLESCYRDMETAAIAKTVFHRTYMGPGVKRHLVREGRVRGALFVPDGPGPFPAVVDLFGGVGGLIEFRAALLASRGILSLHLAYFNYDDLQEGLHCIDLDYFEDAVDYLRSHPMTSGSKVGVVGVSKGAEIAVMMSAHLPPSKLGAIVAINGFHYVYMTKGQYKGKKIPFGTCEMSGVYFTDSGALAFDECIRQYEPCEESIMRLENAQAQFLLISSASDQQIPAECSYKLVERLQKFGKSNYEHLALGEGVGHLVEPCHAPCFAESYQASFQCVLAWGGEKKAHARAQEIAWPKILNFLKKYLGEHQLKHKL